MKFGGSHRPGEDVVADQLAIERVGVEQGLVVEDDVVDPDHVVLPQREIVEVRPALVQRQVECEVGVVVKVGAGRDDPVDETAVDERDEAAHPEPRGGQRTRERQPDGAVGLEELAGEDLAELAEPSCVISSRRRGRSGRRRSRSRDFAVERSDAG